MVRGPDIVARLGGDEFTVIQRGITAPAQAAHLAGRIVRSISEPHYLLGHNVSVGASVGVALAPRDGANADDLIKKADVALYEAKEAGRGIYRIVETETARANEAAAVSQYLAAQANGRAARARREAAQANERAAQANERAAQLEKEAEALKAQAEADRLARVKIEEKLAPRSLTGEQQMAIIKTIAPFAPQANEFVSYQDDPEVAQLVRTLVRTLQAAGWAGQPATGFLMAQLEIGVRVEFSPDKDKAFGPAAKALAEALAAQGIAATFGPREKLESTDRLKIRVGKKHTCRRRWPDGFPSSSSSRINSSFAALSCSRATRASDMSVAIFCAKS